MSEHISPADCSERLPHPMFPVFTEPIEYGRLGLVDYDDLRPHRNSNPTPLDPYHIYAVGGGDYATYARSRLHARVGQACEAYGITDQRLQLAIHQEVAGDALDNRIQRNHESMTRLHDSVIEAGLPLDEAMVDIIRRARVGEANPSELLRLIKEHPEMISVEVAKFVKPLDQRQIANAWNYICAWMMHMQSEFRDAEIYLSAAGEERLISQYLTSEGILVSKVKLGEARSVSSCTEIIVKYTQVAVPYDQVIGGERGQTLTLTDTEGEERHVGLYPLGLSAYYRTADYNSRTGYRRAGPVRRKINEATELDHNLLRAHAIKSGDDIASGPETTASPIEAYHEGYDAVRATLEFETEDCRRDFLATKRRPHSAAKELGRVSISQDALWKERVEDFMRLYEDGQISWQVLWAALDDLRRLAIDNNGSDTE